MYNGEGELTLRRSGSEVREKKVAQGFGIRGMETPGPAKTVHTIGGAAMDPGGMDAVGA